MADCLHVPPPIINSAPRIPPVRSTNDGDVYNPQRVSEWVTKWRILRMQVSFPCLSPTWIFLSLIIPVSGCRVYGGVMD